MSNLYFADDSDTASLYDPSSTSALPFPAPLDRTQFLTPIFNAAEFLSTLTSRFQTLEDLQSELTDLLRSLQKELVDLVNDNYTDFLSLGEKLRGGEEKIEDIRVGLLGFQRDVQGVRGLVESRRKGVAELLEVKRELRRSVQEGRRLLEVEERIGELEERVGIARHSPESHDGIQTGQVEDEEEEQIGDFKEWSDDWTKMDDPAYSSDEEEQDGGLALSDVPPRLRKSLQQLQVIRLLLRKCGEQHPFVLAQRDRISQIKDSLRRDLEAAIRSQPDIKVKQRIIQLRAGLDDE